MIIKSVEIFKSHRPNCIAGARVELEFPDSVSLVVDDLRLLPTKDGKGVWCAWPAYSAGKKGFSLEYHPTLEFDSRTKSEIVARVLAEYETQRTVTA